MRKLILVFALAIAGVGFVFFRTTKIFSESAAVNFETGKVIVTDDQCSDGWRITGYFTPIETDYDSSEVREVEIKNVGAMKFNAAFLKTVFDEDAGFGEGWGKTRFGWYLGNL